ncbi:MAG: coenzyme F420-0:L-glutamate ligase, partial [Bellilinea sp.]
MKKMELTPLEDIPLIQSGDDLAKITLDALSRQNIRLLDGDILVFAQKIVSKAENRLVYLPEVQPSDQAIQIAAEVEKDARFIELVLRESRQVIRKRPGTIIVEHRNGFICANAGIDHSNVRGPYGEADLWVLLLPENPDRSALQIRSEIQNRSGVKIGVLIIDSHGRAWRLGTVG